jgi:hypothetical protein
MKLTRGDVVKEEGSSGEHQLVILAILRHWIKSPDAKDVCDGICKWWLSAESENLGREKVQQALDILVLRGWVVERRSKSAEKIYGLNKDHIRDIEEFLRHESKEN